MVEQRSEALQLLRVYQSQMEAMANQSALISLSINDAKQAIETVSSYKGIKESEEILIPVGTEIFIRGYAKSDDRALLRVGGDVYIYKGFDDVLKGLEEKRSKLEELKKKVDSDLCAIEDEAAKLVGLIQGQQF